MKYNLNIKNKKAFFDYELLNKYKFIAGIVLLGSEVKSIKQNKVSINNSYCKLINNNIYVYDMYISNSSFGENFDSKRIKKILLKKKEIYKIKKKINEFKFNIIPTKILLNNRGYIKLIFFLAKSKKKYDKRQLIKIKDIEREKKKLINN
ncbi:SsrA-binding protein [Candidatus Karelsulcia muelleri]|uniref:SsrA-binding protein n=1 Tax=Candidatus Karelsulcia muelleri PSPU TaxID=1189303 RepID=A0AAD1B340_9FLAO|nr:SsrA-binding protein [Candidatus Karelsulcia muelleri]NJJ98700.1 SsrA-binding protein [Candidatus Karelsulcia muelleri]BAO66353.1 SsrA (tmRNA)-binding protein [Candidatus Karelsulcia muelleri PSPU]